MRTTTIAILAGVASICNLSACTADVHGNTINIDAQLTFQTDVSQDVPPGGSVPVTMNATGVVLVEPNAQPAAADVDKACFFKVFMDDENSEPLLVTAQTHVQIKISEKATAGKHQLICRLFKHDGTATNVKQTVTVNVSGSATVTTTTTTSDAGTTRPDASVAGKF